MTRKSCGSSSGKRRPWPANIDQVVQCVAECDLVPSARYQSAVRQVGTWPLVLLLVDPTVDGIMGPWNIFGLIEVPEQVLRGLTISSVLTQAAPLSKGRD